MHFIYAPFQPLLSHFHPYQFPLPPTNPHLMFMIILLKDAFGSPCV